MRLKLHKALANWGSTYAIFLMILSLVSLESVAQSCLRDRALKSGSVSRTYIPRQRIDNFKFKPIRDPKLDALSGQWKTVQDHQGFLWFAGALGIARYDGYNFKFYRNDPDDPASLSKNYVRDLLVDSVGRLWVATQKGLDLYDPLKDNFIHFNHDPRVPESLGGEQVWTLLEDKFGDIWVGTLDGGLNRYVPETQTFKRYMPDERKGSISSKAIWSLYEDSEGKLWVGTEYDGVDQYDPVSDTFTNIYTLREQPSRSISQQNVLSMAEDSDNNLWIGTHVGLNKIDKKTGEITQYFHDPNNKRSVSGNIIRGLLQSSKGAFWIATDGGGLSVYSPQTDDFIQYKADKNSNNGLLNNKVRSIFEDKSGNIWFGHYPAGVSMLDPYANAFYSYKKALEPEFGLSHDEILSVFETRKGNLYIGTENGLNFLDRKTGKIIHHLPDPNNPHALPKNAVLAVIVDSNERVWVGTWGFGVSQFDATNNLFRNYHNGQMNEARTIYEDCNQRIWFGSDNGIAYLADDGNSFKHYRSEDARPKNIFPGMVRAIFEDSRGNFWVGGDSGIRVMDREMETFSSMMESFSIPDQIFSGGIKAIFEDSQNNVWISIAGGGSVRMSLKNHSYEQFTTYHGLSDTTVTTTLEDNEGIIWLSTMQGISSYDPKTQEFNNYSKEYGLPGDAYKNPAALKTQQGELVFGSTKGLTLFHPLDLSKNTSPPPVVLSDFQLFNQSVDFRLENTVLQQPINHTKNLMLTHKESVFTFEYSALNFLMPEKNRYAYKLEGFDQDWVYAGARRMATYMNVEAGEYTFRVKGSNNDGVWNPIGVGITLKILPPWWKTWWAYFLYISLIIITIVKAIHFQYRKRQIAEEYNRILEIKVAGRTKELQAKNQDIQAMLSNMRQGLLTIEENGLIHKEYSVYLESIFDTCEIAGKNGFELLFSAANVGPDTLAKNQVVIDTLLGEDVSSFDFNAHMLIREYEIQISGLVKTLSLDWNPILEESKVNRLMVTVRDVTKLRASEIEALKKQRDLDIVGQVIKISNGKFLKFEQSSKQFIDENRKLLQNTFDDSAAALKILFRNMHTLKGNSRTLGFNFISDVVHEAESKYNYLRVNPKAQWKVKDLLKDLELIENSILEYSRVFHDLLSRSNQNAEDDHKLIEKIIIILNDRLNLDSKDDSETLSLIDNLVRDSGSKSLDSLLSDILSSLPDIALALGKPAPNVKIDANDVMFKSQHHEMITNVFTHILRNCLDHGIEAPGCRLKLSKPEVGNIDIYVKTTESNVEICVSDDGRGLNIKQLKCKGVELGLWQDSDQPDLKDIAVLIFESGITTKSTVTDISGRGVGMDAVKQFLIREGGDIVIELGGDASDLEYIPFKLVVRLPHSSRVKQTLAH